MNAIIEKINSIGYAFIEFAQPMLIQASVLIVLLLLADFVLRKRVRAVFRYWIWMLVLVKLVLPTSLAGPFSVGNWFGDELASIDVSMSASEPGPIPEVAAPVSPVLPYIDVSNVRPSVYPRPGTLAAPSVAEAEAAVVTAEPIAPPVTPVQIQWQGVVFLLWLTIVAALLLLLAQRAIFVYSLVAQAKNANRAMCNALDDCRKGMKVRAKPKLKISPNATSPAVCGLFRPVILVPNNLSTALGAEDLGVVLLHELAHIKRGDLWVNLVQTLLQIVYFYNPLLWLANAVIRRAREQAVDEAVLVAMGEKASRYPETLVSVAKLAFKRPALSLRLIGVVESKSALTARIKRILSRPVPKSAKLGILGLAAIIITAAFILPMAQAQPYTDRAAKVMKLAETEARQLNHAYIGTEHILLALAEQSDGVAAKVLDNLGIGTDALQTELKKLVKPGSNMLAKSRLPQTPRAKKALQHARKEAKTLDHDYIGTEHILLGLMRQKDAVAAQMLAKLGVSYDVARAEVLDFVKPGPNAKSGDTSLDAKVSLSVSDKDVSTAPKLEFLAWQPQKGEPNVYWESDGAIVSDKANLKLSIPIVRAGIGDGLHPEYEWMRLWFSHPGFGAASNVDLRVYDESGVLLELLSPIGAIETDINQGIGGRGWIVYTVSMGPKNDFPGSCNVELDYAVGPWKSTGSQIPADFHGSTSLGNYIMLGSTGQNTDGKAFVSYFRWGQETSDKQYRFSAITKKGEVLESKDGSGGGLLEMHHSEFVFDAKLKDIKYFQFQTREVKTVVFKNVSLTPGVKTNVQIEVEKSQEAQKVKEVYLPNIDKVQKMLDLDSGELLGITGVNDDDGLFALLDKRGKPVVLYDGDKNKGRLAFFMCKISNRESSSEQGLSVATFGYDELPFEFNVETLDGSRYRIKTVKADNYQCRLEYYQSPITKTPAGLSESIESLLDTLRTAKGRQRAHAAEELAKYGGTAVPAITEMLQDDNLWAAHALGLIGPEAEDAVPALIKSLTQGGDGGVRGFSASALRQIGPGAVPAIPALIGTLKDKNANTRMHAAEALGFLSTGERDVMEALTAALQDEDETVRKAAARSLKRIEGIDSHTHNPNYTATLPDGVTVELLGVCDVPAKGKQWWAADGSPVENVYWDGSGVTHEETEKARQVVFRIDSRDTDPDLQPTINLSPHRKSHPPGSWAGAFVVRKDNRTLEDLRGCSFSLHDDHPTVDISATIGFGPWKTQTTKNANSYGNLTSTFTNIGTVIVNDPTEKDGETTISATLLNRVKAWRFVAVDKQGKIHDGSSSSSMSYAGANIPEHQLCTSKIALPLSQIEKFHFQTRKVKTAIFKNVSLRPGVKTDVQIEVEKDASDDSKRHKHVTFKEGMSIRDALRFLGKAHKKNIVPSDKVAGQVPVTELFDVTLEEALQAILGTHKYIIDGNLIRVYTEEEFKAINPKQKPTHKYSATLANGATVELAAYLNPSENGLNWYSFDGKPTTIEGVTEADVAGIGRVVALRIIPSTDIQLYVKSYRREESTSLEEWSVGSDNIWLVDLDEDRRFVNLEVGVTLLPPFVSHTIDLAGRNLAEEIVVNKFDIAKVSCIKQKDPNSCKVTFQYVEKRNWSRWIQFAVLDKAGKTYELDRGSGSSSYISFKVSLPIKELASVIIRSRVGRRGSAKFKNVSLDPNYQTDVQIEVEPMPEGYDPVDAEIDRVGAMSRHWPSFRGMGGAGISAFANAPADWDGPSGKGILWKSPVPLGGHSSPIVWDDRVFVSGGKGNELNVYCYDGSSGRLLWTGSVPMTKPKASEKFEVMKDVGLAASTMVTDGRRVCSIFLTGDLGCFDFSGRRLWTKSLGIPDSIYGHASSLSMYGNLAIVQLDQGDDDDGKSRIIALDMASGLTVWETKRPVANSWASPIVARIGGRGAIITCADPWVIAYDPARGNELWRAECLAGDIAASPTYANGLTFVVEPYSKIVAIRTNGRGDVTKTHIAWSVDEPGPDICSLLSNGEFVFALNSDGLALCLNASDGKKLWEEDIKEDFRASPSLVGDRLYLLSEKGTMFILQAGAEYKLLSKSELGEKCHASPAFADGRIYIRGLNNLYCIASTESASAPPLPADDSDKAVVGNAQSDVRAIIERLRVAEHVRSGKGSALVVEVKSSSAEQSSFEAERIVDFKFKGDLTRSDAFASNKGKQGDFINSWARGPMSSASYSAKGSAAIEAEPFSGRHRSVGHDFHPETFWRYRRFHLADFLERMAGQPDVTMKITQDSQGRTRIVSRYKNKRFEVEEEFVMLFITAADGIRPASWDFTVKDSTGNGTDISLSRLQLDWQKYAGIWYISDATLEWIVVHGGLRSESRTTVTIRDFTPNVEIEDKEFTLDGLNIPPGTTVHDSVLATTYKYAGSKGDSAERLRRMGTAILMHANDYEDKTPDNVDQLKPFLDADDMKWLLRNVQYIGKGKSTNDDPEIPVAYDRTMLQADQAKGTHVLSMCGVVSFKTLKQLEELGTTIPPPD